MLLICILCLFADAAAADILAPPTPQPDASLTRVETENRSLTIMALLRSALQYNDAMTQIAKSPDSAAGDVLPYIRLQANEALASVRRARQLADGFDTVATAKQRPSDPILRNLGVQIGEARTQFDDTQTSLEDFLASLGGGTSGTPARKLSDVRADLARVQASVQDSLLAQNRLNATLGIPGPGSMSQLQSQAEPRPQRLPAQARTQTAKKRTARPVCPVCPVCEVCSSYTPPTNIPSNRAPGTAPSDTPSPLPTPLLGPIGAITPVPTPSPSSRPTPNRFASPTPSPTATPARTGTMSSPWPPEKELTPTSD